MSVQHRYLNERDDRGGRHFSVFRPKREHHKNYSTLHSLSRGSLSLCRILDPTKSNSESLLDLLHSFSFVAHFQVPFQKSQSPFWFTFLRLQSFFNRTNFLLFLQLSRPHLTGSSAPNLHSTLTFRPRSSIPLKIHHKGQQQQRNKTNQVEMLRNHTSIGDYSIFDFSHLDYSSFTD